MTLTVKNPSESGSGKPSPRSNPVCLEAAVTIRSLPSEDASAGAPVREEARTVIVFDNGAVLRSTTHLQAGRTIIVSNSNGREVVCRVANGRNLPSIKGYVEVEFIDSVNDFWGIHQDATPTAIAPPGSPVASREFAPPPAAPSVSNVVPFERVPASTAVTSNPVTREPNSGQRNPVLPPSAASPSDPAPLSSSRYSHAQVAVPDSIATWQSPEPKAPAARTNAPVSREVSASELSSSASPSVPSHDFMSKGLMAYEQPESSGGASSGRAPLIVGIAALVLASACGAFFLTHRAPAPGPVATTAAVNQSPAPASPPTSDAPAAVPAANGEAAQASTQPPEQNAPPQQDLLQVDPVAPAAAAAPVPAVATSPPSSDDRTMPRNVRKSDRTLDKADKTTSSKQAEAPAPRRAAIPNLSMASPSAPIKNVSDLGEGSAPLAEAAVSEPVGATSAGLLTSAGKTSKPPVAPPSAPPPPPAPKIVHDPKLVSSVRPAYPPAARQANVQGSVTISAGIDENGKVVSAKALNGPLLLREAAIDSVKQWKYSPGTVDGRPVASQVTVSVEFRMN